MNCSSYARLQSIFLTTLCLISRVRRHMSLNFKHSKTKTLPYQLISCSLILSFFSKIISYYSEVIVMLIIHAMPVFTLYFHSFSFLFYEILSPLPFYLNLSRQLRKHSLGPPRYLPWIPVIPIAVFCTIAIN